MAEQADSQGTPQAGDDPLKKFIAQIRDLGVIDSLNDENMKKFFAAREGKEPQVRIVPLPGQENTGRLPVKGALEAMEWQANAIIATKGDVHLGEAEILRRNLDNFFAITPKFGEHYKAANHIKYELKQMGQGLELAIKEYEKAGRGQKGLRPKEEILRALEGEQAVLLDPEAMKEVAKATREVLVKALTSPSFAENGAGHPLVGSLTALQKSAEHILEAKSDQFSAAAQAFQASLGDAINAANGLQQTSPGIAGFTLQFLNGTQERVNNAKPSYRAQKDAAGETQGKTGALSPSGAALYAESRELLNSVMEQAKAAAGPLATPDFAEHYAADQAENIEVKTQLAARTAVKKGRTG